MLLEMNSPPVEPTSLTGAQEPRIRVTPDYVSSAGHQAIKLAALAGLILDPWQQLALLDMLGERPDGKWAAFQFGLCIPRQNGKGSILEARELVGLFLLGEKLIVHSAHEQITSTKHFLRLKNLIEGVPEFEQRVMKISQGKGAEAIVLRGGQEIIFKTRTADGGRGLSGDTVVLDEAMILRQATMGSLVPTMAAQSITGNPQLIYAGSAVDEEKDEHGVVFASVRERAINGTGGRLGFHEYSVDCKADDITDAILEDPERWAQANPGMGIRISQEYISDEKGALDWRSFAIERLGAQAWPRTDGLADVVIPPEAWKTLADERSAALNPVCLAVDVDPDRSHGAICSAGNRVDGLEHLEFVERQRGTKWIIPRVKELIEKHEPIAVVLDGKAAAGSLLTDFEDADIEVTPVNAGDLVTACGMFYDAVMDTKRIRHLDEPELAAAIRGAVKRPLGDAWAWSRRNSSVDISPLVAITLAYWGLVTLDAPGEPRVWDLRDYA
jgi:phage terminase large subunit-like protein